MGLDLPQSFVDAVRQRRLLPFIGAGFSKNISGGFPNWSELIRHSADLLDYDPDILLSQGDYLQIAEYLNTKHRLGELYNLVAKQLDNDSFDVAYSRAHLLLSYFDVQSIFTTNWDSWIEKGFEHEGIPFSKIVTHHDFVSPRRCSNKSTRRGALHPSTALAGIRQAFKETTIVKFHGDFSNHDSIVFKESDYYNRLDFDHPLDIKLRSEIIGRSVLFLGYSFSDPNVRYIWHKLTKAMRVIEAEDQVKSFFVTHLSNPLQIDLFRRQNIDTILLNPNNIGGDLVSLFETVVDLQTR
jgi:hypothetical protein